MTTSDTLPAMSRQPHDVRMLRFRFARSYTLFLKILTRYLFLYLLKRVFGSRRLQNITEDTHVRTSQEIVAHIIKLKGLYIKVGQTLSIMTNFLPKVFTEGLESLQDAVPPHPYSQVEERFKNDFKKLPLQMFASFDREPIAAASLGQVHVATLSDGTKLAVKLQHPNIEKTVLLDLKTIKRIFSSIDFFFGGYGLKQVYQECAEMVLKELDYQEEAASIERIEAHFKDDPGFVFPKVFHDLSSKTILTTSFIEGIKITNLEDLKKAQIQVRPLAIALINGYCRQIFVDGVYHADPHPGNIIVQIAEQSGPGAPEPLGNEGAAFKIALIDYGATAQLSPNMKAGMILFVEGLLKKDTKILAASMKQMGFVARYDNEETFEKIVDYFYSKIKGIRVENFREINLTDFQHLSDIIELGKMDISLKELTTTFHVPKEWILLERTLLLMMGLVAHLDPHLNPVDVVLPYVEKFVLGERRLPDLLLQTSKDLILSYIQLPHQASRLIKKLEEGKISIAVKNLKGHTKAVSAGLKQLTYAVLTIGLLFLARMYAHDGDFVASQWCQYGSGLTGILLVLNLIRNRL